MMTMMDQVLSEFTTRVPPLLQVLIVLLGTLALLRKSVCTARKALGAFAGGPGNLSRRYGKWAVVTGATDGIGKAFAAELGRKGMNVLLISRTEQKLSDVKSEMEENIPGVEFRTHQCDFSQLDGDAKDGLREALANLEVGVLVNNVGISYPFPQYFHELSDERTDQLVDLNVKSVVFMTRAVLPGMLERKRGTVVNVSSFAGTVTSPLLALYSSTKRDVEMMTRGLHEEYSSQGIHFQCQIPLFVATKLASIRRSSFFVPSPAGYARAGVAAIGKGVVVTPYWPHRLQQKVLGLLPDFIMNMYIKSMHEGIRKRGFKKLAEKEKNK